jgi:hypothetical protein
MKRIINIKSYKVKSLIAFIFMIAFACTADFDDLNKNPNAATEDNVNPSFLLTNVYNQSILDPGMHERITQLTNDVFAQYYANEGFSTQQGVTNDEWLTEFYNNYHNSMVASLNLAIRIGENSGNAYNETEIARIWRVWVYSRATDLWGDIPYFDAANGTGENPKYDSQKEIYLDMLKELKEASAALSTDNPTQIVGQDYIYQDNVAKWKKFANSLRLRLAMRISLVEPAISKQHAEEAIAAGVFTSESENCIVPRGPGFGWGYDYQYTYYYGWGAESMSRSMENLLTGLGGQAFPAPPTGVTYTYNDVGLTLSLNDENTLDPNANKFKSGVPSTVDPRGPIYYNVTTAESGAKGYTPGNFKTGVLVKYGANAADTVRVSTLGRWHGVPAGLSSGAAGRSHYSVFNTTRLGGLYAKAPSRGYEVMTYHEVCFLLAEAAQRGYTVGTGTAQSWYEEGIRQSMKWHSDAVALYAETVPKGSGDTPAGIAQRTYYETLKNSVIPDAKINAYITSTAENTYGTTVSYTNNSGKTYLGNPVDDPLEKIITQKYIALFPDGGWEAWADHRRLHLPILIPFTSGLDSRYTVRNGGPDNFTKRLTYPGIEELNNAEKYNEAIARQGADVETTNLWWDVN